MRDVIALIATLGSFRGPIVRGGSWNYDPGVLPLVEPHQVRTRFPELQPRLPCCPCSFSWQNALTSLNLTTVDLESLAFRQRRVDGRPQHVGSELLDLGHLRGTELRADCGYPGDGLMI